MHAVLWAGCLEANGTHLESVLEENAADQYDANLLCAAGNGDGQRRGHLGKRVAKEVHDEGEGRRSEYDGQRFNGPAEHSTQQ